MHSVLLGLPSNGTSGMLFQGKGREYRTYKPRPFSDVNQYNSIYFENRLNKPVAARILLQPEVGDGQMDSYPNPLDKYGRTQILEVENTQQPDGGALIQAKAAGLMQAAGLMKAAGLDEEEDRQVSSVLHPRNTRVPKKRCGKGIAFNEEELEKLRGCGIGGGSSETTDDVLKFFKTKIKKGKKIPMSLFSRLLSAKESGGSIGRKLTKPSKLQKYIELDEEGNPIVKRGGGDGEGGFWSQLANFVPNLVKQGQETYDFVYDAKVKQQQRDNQEIQNKIDRIRLERELNELQSQNQQPPPAGQGAGANRMSREELIRRLMKIREAKLKRSHLKAAKGF